MDPFVAFSLLGSVLPVAVLAVLLVLVIGGRHEPDPLRERPRAVYLSAVSFLSVLTLLVALFVVVVSLLGLTTDDDSIESFSMGTSVRASQSIRADSASSSDFAESDEDFTPIEAAQSSFSSSYSDEADNADISSAVRAGIVALLALGVFLFHDPKLTALVARSTGPAVRVYSKYLYSLCFIAVLIGLGAAAVALFGLFSAAAPGVTEAGSRGDALRSAATAGALALGAGLIFVRHWRRVDRLAAPQVDYVEAAPVVAPDPVPEAPEPPAPAEPRGRIVRRPRPPAE